MMNKASTYVLVALLIILIGALTFIMIYGIKDGGFKNKKAKLLLSESYRLSDIEKININVKSSDVYIKESEDDTVYVDIYDVKKEDVSSVLTDGELKIVSKGKFNFCFFCFGETNKKVEIKLPKSFAGSIKSTATSGDFTMDSYKDVTLNLFAKSGDVDIKNVKKATIKVTSGDIEIKNIKDANIKATSGDIEIDKVTGKVDIKVTSGDIDIDKFDITGNSNIKATSGDIKIKSIDNAFINTSVKSGDVKVNGSNRTAEYELDINVTSGDIRVN